MRVEDLESIIESARDLPALPPLIIKLLELTDNPEVSAKDLSDAISQDQGLAAKVLQMANSAFYGCSRRISSINDATIILGFKAIRCIIMAASASNIMNRELEGYALDQGELWRHSQCSAIAARHICNQSRSLDLDGNTAYTAALLHDIGKIILDDYMKDVYPLVISKAAEDKISFFQAETTVLGFNHAQAGARLAQKWNLPQNLVEAIAFHHSPEEAGSNSHLISIVNIADSLCLSLGIGATNYDTQSCTISKNALKQLGIGDSDIQTLLPQLTDLFANQDSF